jgi:hypothetical protein
MCWLREFSPPSKERGCEGRLDRAHLVTKQLLKREGLSDFISDARAWVPACRRHHTMFDSYNLTVPRERLPEPFLTLMADLDLSWWVDRRYGALEVTA